MVIVLAADVAIVVVVLWTRRPIGQIVVNTVNKFVQNLSFSNRNRS